MNMRWRGIGHDGLNVVVIVLFLLLLKLNMLRSDLLQLFYRKPIRPHAFLCLTLDVDLVGIDTEIDILLVCAF